LLKVSRELHDVEQRLQQQLQDRALSEPRREALVKEYVSEIQRRQENTAKCFEESDVSPALRARGR
jgi:uncharacterized membrane protein YukC